MSLSSLYLDAFTAVAKIRNFSKAAETLFITQSALSQRIKNLESELGVTLFFRKPSGIEITEIGERLLRYCQLKDVMETELLSRLTPNREGEMAGILRIGVFSSILGTVIIPSLSTLLRENPKLRCDFIHRESGWIDLLNHAEADFIILDYPLNMPAVEQHILGYEEYVVIESTAHKCPDNVYLDNAPEDPATEQFFIHQGGDIPGYSRLFMGETYAILAGVEEGLGRAVMPIHLLREKRDLKIVGGFKKYRKEITLHYFKQNYYPKAYSAVINQLISNCSGFLNLKT